MPARKIPRWTEAEIEVLRTVYVQHGLQAAQQKLPDRAGQSIYVKANKLGLHTNHRPARLGVYRHIGPEALRLYAELGSYTAVARCLGVCEATATNAVHFERNCQSCNEPLERGLDGRFTRSAIDRLRQLFRKGLTHRDIQLLTGVSAGTLTRERRRYEE